MPEDAEKQISFPNFPAPVSDTLREVIVSDTTTRDKISINGLGVTIFKSGGVSMMLKTVMEVAQDYTVFY